MIKPKNVFEDRAFGCICGAFIADACGSYVEFANSELSEEKMDECMRMPGGGVFTNIGPG